MLRTKNKAEYRNRKGPDAVLNQVAFDKVRDPDRGNSQCKGPEKAEAWQFGKKRSKEAGVHAVEWESRVSGERRGQKGNQEYESHRITQSMKRTLGIIQSELRVSLESSEKHIIQFKFQMVHSGCCYMENRPQGEAGSGPEWRGHCNHPGMS